ncbi:hypothetical protein JMJ77_0002173 [Colletotrichum scovillei]|uniref:Uncharacterized protein n=1 Tax=Colletotrichum scovillei TaxID=1209932 RepID=A0A9P7R8H8_9PEZI|nr:hypothetical protein JMJ77_0002173 [Colletotrichum scovillei]KAG7070592.1 hypothetical protein JMJ76_0001839 [Colletotrichum scovillei]KAG7078841.1 hypothetical protein JMJ78_0002504 [Colletotrichum scovillei]
MSSTESRRKPSQN